MGRLSTLTASANKEWLCEVAPRPSNPAHLMTVTECVPPIRELYSHLAKGNAFPLCRSAYGHVNFESYGMERFSDGPQARERVDDERGRSNDGICNVFVPSGGKRPRQEYDKRILETRSISGELVWNEIVEEDAVARSRPRYLDHIVEGPSQRIWF